MTYFRNFVRLSLVFLGVAFGLVGNAAGVSAQEASSASSGQPSSVEASSAPDDGAEIGDGFYVEREAPRPDPNRELRSEPSPASPATAPASAPAATRASSGTATVAPASPAASVASKAPARATEVRGVQIERPSVVSSAAGPESLARTGVFTGDLLVLAASLLAVGALLIQVARPRRVV